MKNTYQNADPTRRKIIKAATAMFCKYGFAGTSIEKIASKAKINHSLIFHHYGNKQKLWVAVKQAIVADATKTQPILPSIDLPVEDFLAKLFRQSVDFYRQTPAICQMINWQRIEGQGNTIGITRSQTSEQWMQALRSYQQQNVIDNSLQPEYMLTLICSLACSAVMDANTLIQETFDDYIDFCVAMMLKAFTIDTHRSDRKLARI